MSSDVAVVMASDAAANAPPAPAPPAQRAPLLFRAYDVVERVQKPGRLGKKKRIRKRRYEKKRRD